MTKPFGQTADEQGWTTDTMLGVMSDFIASQGVMEQLDEYATERAHEENGVEHGGKAVPDFEMDVTGEYQGNAFAEQAEYRIRIAPHDEEHFSLTVESASGNIIGSLALSTEDADGIEKMASTDQGLDAYGDDWKIPEGMNRTLTWTMPTDRDDFVRLDEGQIDAIAEWFRYALGEKTWDWEEQGDEWEY